MTVITITQRIKNKNFILGIGFGWVAGFFIRDEFYFPTHEKIKQLGDSFTVKSMELDLEKKKLKE